VTKRAPQEEETREENLRETQATAQRMETHQAQSKEDLVDKEVPARRRPAHARKGHQRGHNLWHQVFVPADSGPVHEPDGTGEVAVEVADALDPYPDDPCGLRT